jgi:hypothetical protein
VLQPTLLLVLLLMLLQIADRGVLLDAELTATKLKCHTEYVYVKFRSAAAARLALQRQAEQHEVSVHILQKGVILSGVVLAEYQNCTQRAMH